MNKIVLKTRDFEKAKNGLKKFSQKKEAELKLETVDESGSFFGLGNHKVTGAELNERLGVIQKHLIDINQTNIDTVKEFGEVYNALESLDKDYIPAILTSIKAAEKANVEVKKAQGDIRGILQNQKKTLDILKGFKKEVESYKHISDIDKLWGDFLVAQQRLVKADDLIQNTKAKANKNTQDINTLNDFKNRIEKIKHINNVDELWNSSNILREKISAVEAQIEDLISRLDIQSNSIDLLNDFKNAIDSVEHIKDVDNIWDKLETTTEKISEHDDRILECKNAIDSNTQSIDTLFTFKSTIDGYEHLCDIDSMWKRENEFDEKLDNTNNVIKAQEKQIADIEKVIKEIQENSQERNQFFTRKLKIAYAIAGSAMGVAIIEFILILLKVI